MTWLYFVCESCGHVETCRAGLEPVTRCENCGARKIVDFDDLEKAEDWSQLVLDGEL